jgi:ankyrin repeat protein
LHKAAFWGHGETVAYLLNECKLDPNKQDHAGDTALHDAARFGHSTVIRKLLAAGASTDIKNKEGKDINDVARQYGKDPIVAIPAGGIAVCEDAAYESIWSLSHSGQPKLTLEQLNTQTTESF